MKTYHLIRLNIRHRQSGQVRKTFYFVWTRPNFWLSLCGFFIVRDVHWMISGRYEEIALASALIWSVIAWFERRKLYAVYESDWDNMIEQRERGAP